LIEANEVESSTILAAPSVSDTSVPGTWPLVVKPVALGSVSDFWLVVRSVEVVR
jgi:hypothetical protein